MIDEERKAERKKKEHEEFEALAIRGNCRACGAVDGEPCRGGNPGSVCVARLCPPLGPVKR